MDFAVIQALETRRLLSGSLLMGGALLVNGSAAADSIVVGLSADGTKVDVTINDAPVKHYNRLAVRNITIGAGAGSDTVTIEETNGVLADRIHIQIMGGLGADTITGSSNADLLIGGAGNDSISGGAGRDLILAKDGADTVDAGAGDDAVYGGAGDDVIRGGDGNDALWGSLGKDYIEGNAGDDLLGGILGANTVLGGEGNDRFLVTTPTNNPVTDYDPSLDTMTILRAEPAV